MAINYQTQEICFKGEITDVENIACNYLKSCGYSKVFKTSRMKAYPQHCELLDNYYEVMEDITGRPDLIAITGRKIYLFEVKRIYDNVSQDSLRQSQLAWHERHPELDMTVLFIKIKEEETSKKYRLLKEENKKLKDFLLNFDYTFMREFQYLFLEKVKGISEEIYIEMKHPKLLEDFK